jgi:hypothetical protein
MARPHRGLQLLDVGGDIVRPDRSEPQTTVVAPAEIPVACPETGPAGVRVADIGGEEFDIAPSGLVAEIGDQRRHDVHRTLAGGNLGLLDRRRKLLVGSLQNRPQP